MQKKIKISIKKILQLNIFLKKYKKLVKNK